MYVSCEMFNDQSRLSSLGEVQRTRGAQPGKSFATSMKARRIAGTSAKRDQDKTLNGGASLTSSEDSRELAI